MIVDRKFNLIFYAMEIDVRRSLSVIDCSVLYVQMSIDRKCKLVLKFNKIKLTLR